MSGTKSNRPHLKFLDGIRGLAASYVLLHHSIQAVLVQFHYHQASPRAGRYVSLLYTVVLAYGHYAVDTFIVLSGFVLMLPVALSAERKLPKGTLSYLKNRSRRILPPYYAALVITLIVLAVLPKNVPIDDFRETALPAFTPGVLISHLLLFHNFNGNWDRCIDPPMWTVVIEWQIYFLLPLLLLPAWRKLGIIGMLLVAAVVGISPVYIFHTDQSVPWYLFLFASGATAAALCFSCGDALVGIRDKTPWGLLATGTGIIVVAIQFLNRQRWGHVRWAHYVQIDTWGSLWPMDLLVGCAISFLIVWLSRECVHHRRPMLLRLLDCRPLIWLSTFSYSLYLVHVPVLFSLTAVLYTFRLSGNSNAILIAILCVPLSMATGYLFFCIFERPFQRSRALAPLPSRQVAVV